MDNTIIAVLIGAPIAGAVSIDGELLRGHQESQFDSQKRPVNSLEERFLRRTRVPLG